MPEKEVKIALERVYYDEDGKLVQTGKIMGEIALTRKEAKRFCRILNTSYMRVRRAIRRMKRQEEKRRRMALKGD